jgi:hypothetical protein
MHGGSAPRKTALRNGELLLGQLDRSGKFVPSIPPSSVPPSISKDRERKENLEEEGRDSVENENEI